MKKPRSKLGQVFLKDKNILDKIVRYADVREGEWVLEIGPGRGALTEFLLMRGANVIAFEIDPKLVSELKKSYGLLLGDRLILVEEDFLRADLKEKLKEHGIPAPLKVVSNIPYYITTPILEKLIKERELFSEIYLTIQKEVARRLVASPDTSEYGSLTLYLAMFFDIEVLFNIPKTCFRPIPKVDSAFVKMKVREEPPIEVSDPKFLEKLIRFSFGGRRKKLKTVLKNNFGKLEFDKIESESGISLDRRGETLSLEEFEKLARTVKDHLKK